MMTKEREMKMINKLEELRVESLEGHRVYALSDGYQILGAGTEWHVDLLKKLDYWVCAIFENGHRVEA